MIINFPKLLCLCWKYISHEVKIHIISVQQNMNYLITIPPKLCTLILRFQPRASVIVVISFSSNNFLKLGNLRNKQSTENEIILWIRGFKFGHTHLSIQSIDIKAPMTLSQNANYIRCFKMILFNNVVCRDQFSSLCNVLYVVYRA